MAEYPKEFTTSIPEHAYLKNDPNTNWDERARGMGGTLDIPVTSCAEENLLCLNGDRYYDQGLLNNFLQYFFSNFQIEIFWFTNLLTLFISFH